MTSTGLTPSTQISPDATTAVGLIALLEAGADVHHQLTVRQGARRFWPAHPLVEPSSRNPERLAHLSRLPHLAMLGDEGELHRGSLVNKAMAFFKMSRSALVLANSRRNLDTSASSGRCLPRPGNACPPFSA